MLELVTAYSVFANNGSLIPPAFVKKITDRDGRVLESYTPVPQKAIDPGTAFVMTNLLQGVVRYGTGTAVRALGRPVAGKTGTTNNRHDTWFVGYTPQYVAGVWVGYDDRKTLPPGSSGGHTAAPLWLSFMSGALKDKPVAEFTPPPDVQFAKTDPRTGLLASPDSSDAEVSVFKEGTAPSEYAPKPGESVDDEDLFTGDVDQPAGGAAAPPGEGGEAPAPDASKPPGSQAPPPPAPEAPPND